MADNFGLKIGVEGEKEFKKALSDINQSFKVLGSEMTLVTSQFDKQDKSVQAAAPGMKSLISRSTPKRRKSKPCAPLCKTPPTPSAKTTAAPRTGRFS